MASLARQRPWRGKGDYFRFNIEFAGKEPSLDDLGKMQELKATTRSMFAASQDLVDSADCLVASLFYFELESLPRFEDGVYACVGHILCRRRSDSEPLLARLSKNSARFAVDGHRVSGRVEDRSFVGKGGCFRKKIEFSVKGLEQEVSISLREGHSKARNISGSPFTISKVIEDQGLDAHFGTADHKEHSRTVRLDQKKRKRSGELEDASGKKRQRQ
jgi:hypothetical protein